MCLTRRAWYVTGRKAVELYPYVLIAAGACISTKIASYLERLNVGITRDAYLVSAPS